MTSASPESKLILRLSPVASVAGEEEDGADQGSAVCPSLLPLSLLSSSRDEGMRLPKSHLIINLFDLRPSCGKRGGAERRGAAVKGCEAVSCRRIR